MKKILIVTDSLALPRQYPEKCNYEDTWPSLLKKNIPYEIHQLSIGGATIDELYNQVNSYHLSFSPDIIIIQSGIVDCAPRALSKKELYFVNSNFIFRILFSKIIKKNTNNLRRIRRKTYTTIKQYEIFIEKFNALKKDSSIKLFFLTILPSSEEYEKKVPGIEKNICQYNEVIQKKSNYIDLNEIPKEGIMSDFFHINKIGHQFIYQKLVRKLNND